METPKTPTAAAGADPKDRQILDLEQQNKNLGVICKEKDERIVRLQKDMEDLKRAYERAWEIRLVKRLLRVLIVLVWFASSLFGLVAPFYFFFIRGWNPNWFLMSVIAVVLGGLLWIYIHEKD